MTPQLPTSTSLRAEVLRLIDAAQAFGEEDHYAGKRDHPRTADGLQLEVTTNPQDRSAGWAVSMQDISDGGASFWSKQNLVPRSAVYLREFNARETRPWIPALVKHSTRGIRGHLIGVAFELPKEAPQQMPPKSPPSPVHQHVGPAPKTLRRMRLGL